MSGEKHDNQKGLQNRLDALQVLPGEAGMDKDLVWEKLYSRMQKKSARIWFGWQRIAAACVLLIILVSFWMVVEHKKTEPVRNTPNTLIAKPLSSPVTIRQQELSKPAAVKNTRPVRTGYERKRIRAIVTPETLLSGTTPAEAVDIIPATAHPAIPAIADPAVSGKLMAVQAKKKLRVVHINEVDEPVEEENTARYSPHHAFRVKWFEHPDPINASLESDHSAYEMLKINLSSPN